MQVLRRTAARRTAVVALAAAFAALLGGAPAWAQPADVPGLQVTVRAEDPRAPVVVLTNGAATACQVATTALGTVSLLRVEQDGAPIEPVLFDAAFTDGLDRAIAARLRTLAPGESVELRLPVLPIGATGQALEGVAWSATAGAVGSLYPVKPDRPLRLDVWYAVPVQPPGDASLCAVAAGAGGPAPADRGRPNWGLIGGGVLLLLLLVTVLLWLLRRRRSAQSATAVLLMLGALVLVDGWRSPAARAEILVDESLSEAWSACSATLHGPGGDPAGILPALEAAGVNVHIVPANGDETHEGAISPTEIFVYWDPEDRHAYAGTGGNADPCTSLYHELHHAWEDAQGGQDRSECVTADGPSGLPVAEVNATRAQNQLRRLLGLPERSHYGPTPLPEGACLPPEEQPREEDEGCSDGGCADSNGDPHLATFDGRRYDFQAVGEFVAVRDGSGGLEIQVRQSPIGNSRTVSVNTAVALDVAGDRVQVTLDRRRPTLHIGGQQRQIERVDLPAGGSVAPAGRGLSVEWPDGSTATLTPISIWGLRLSIDLVRARAGKLEGLLGDFNGDPTNDIRQRGGQPITEPTFAALYPGFADSWRVTAASSLFFYEPGTSTDTYTDRTFPDREARVDDLPNRAGAQALCRRFGVTEPVAFAACVLDVGLTGQPDFAVALRGTQAFIGSFGIDGTETVLRVDQPGQTATMTFAGTQGQVVFVDVRLTTLPDLCSPLEIQDSTGRRLSSGCIINGRGYVDRTVLPATGEYSFVLRPRSATGTAWVKLSTAVDQVGPIAPGGEVMATIAQPGAQAQFTFAGTAGQIIFVDVPSATLPDQCSPLEIRDPTGRRLSSGCVIFGRGYVDRTILPTTGEYTVVVNPANRTTGDARVRLVSATDQIGTVSVNGPEVTATVSDPGGHARFTFNGTAGQMVSVEVVSSTLPDQCSPLELRGPDGRLVRTGCVINGKGGISQVALPTTGTYTLVVNPTTRTIGVTRLALRS